MDKTVDHEVVETITITGGCPAGCPDGECYCPDGSEPLRCGHHPAGGTCPLGHCYACGQCFCEED